MVPTLWTVMANMLSIAAFPLLPSHFHCSLLHRHQTPAEAAKVWHALGSHVGFRADITCCSFDKIKSILEYAELVLSFKLRTMEQQVDFAEEVEKSLVRSKSGSLCQPLMFERFHSRLDALKEVLPLGRRGLRLARHMTKATLRQSPEKILSEKDVCMSIAFLIA